MPDWPLGEGQLVEHNQFIRCGGGVHGFGAIQIHGGRDHLVRQNLFVDCPAAITFSAWKLDRWQAFVGPKFPSPDLDRDLDLARYPALGPLMETANGSEFQANLALQCKAFLLRPPPNTIDRENRIEPDGSPPATDRPAEADLQRVGINPAWAARIGIYPDFWRELPEYR
jgi:hypothetical protein